MEFQTNCPVPLRHATVQMAHGGGGRLMRELLEGVMLPAFRNEALESRHDSAVMPLGSERLAFTTDTFVVRPRFFPGGDIGKLAVVGTVNDLAMAGARPLYLSTGMVLEEGYPLDELREVVLSMRRAAEACGVSIVTGDTKVVDRGKGDGIYINTAGIGWVAEGIRIGPGQVRPGDAVLVSGDVGRHGVAVLSVREGITFQTTVESDCAPLSGLVEALLDAGIPVHCLRDATRGGLAAVLNEIAQDGSVGVEVREDDIPVSAGVASACDLLGIDPLYVACEGRLVAFVPEGEAARALETLRSTPGGEGAARIGSVKADGSGTVLLRTRMGTRRVLDLLSGEQLPRIC